MLSPFAEATSEKNSFSVLADDQQTMPHGSEQ